MREDWLWWHRHYDDPVSSLSQRLDTVRHGLRRALAEAPRADDGTIRLTDVCAGEGRDLLPVLAERDLGPPIHAVLLEIDAGLVDRTRAAAAALGLAGVDVRHADAGTTTTYREVPAAQVLMLCGVLGATSARRT